LIDLASEKALLLKLSAGSLQLSQLRVIIMCYYHCWCVINCRM